MRYDLTMVRDACKGLSQSIMRAAVPRDGQDAAPPRLSFVGDDPNPGLAPIYAGAAKYKVSYTTEQTPDGDWIGMVHWSLMGKSGTFPAVTDYMDVGVPPSAPPTYWPDETQATNCAATCADVLRKQMVELFHTP